MKLYEQIERKLAHMINDLCSKPWQKGTDSHKWDKQKKHRVERRRAKQDPECAPLYRKYDGWEY